MTKTEAKEDDQGNAGAEALIGTRRIHRATVRGLGLRRMNHTVELEDTPAVRGMINKVNYLVKIEAIHAS